MVYCGIPSKGCSHCRERKIRCDQATPSCGQCSKAKKTCPGYRNQLDLAFRDQNDETISKVRARTARPKDVGTGPDRIARFKDAGTGQDRATRRTSTPAKTGRARGMTGSLASPPALTPPIDGPDLADDYRLRYFMHHFVTVTSGPPNGHFQYLPALLRSGCDEMLSASIYAAGSAIFANIHKSDEVMDDARKQYAAAIRHVEAALRSETQVVGDSTLLSILILGLFETITGGSKLAVKAWNYHITGASALVKLRGRAQMHHPVGRGLLLEVTGHIMTSCVQREIPLPSYIMPLRIEAARGLHEERMIPFMAAVERHTQFRASIREGTLRDFKTIFETALQIDEELLQSFRDPPAGWRYETILTGADPEVVFHGAYDVYHDYLLALLWNHWRCIRVMIHTIIKRQLRRGCSLGPEGLTFVAHAAQFSASDGVIAEMRDGILRTVPQHVGYVMRRPFGPAAEPGPIRGPRRREAPSADPASPQGVPAIHGSCLLWPLYLSASNSLHEPGVKAWIIEWLRYIGDTMGMGQGTDLANYLETVSQSPSQGSPGLEAEDEACSRVYLDDAVMTWQW